MKKRPTPFEKPSALEPRQHHNTDLFPGLLPAAPAPILPRPGTVKDAALAAIIAGKITQVEFRRSWRLAAYIDELIDDGWRVRSEWVTPEGWSAPIKRCWIVLAAVAGLMLLGGV